MEQLNFQICIQHQSTDVENSRQMSTSGKATEKWRFPVAFHLSLFSTFFVHGRCKNKEKLKTTTVCWKTYVTFFRYSVILWNFDASSIEAFTSSSVLMKSPAHIFFHRNLEENLRAYWIQIHPLTTAVIEWCSSVSKRKYDSSDCSFSMRSASLLLQYAVPQLKKFV